MRKSTLHCFVALLLCGAVLPAATFTWPGPAPCNTTLQACITAVPAGSAVEIATNGLVAETPTIDKSLTVRPAAGFTPTVDGSVFVLGGAAALDVTVQGLTVQGTLLGRPGTGDFRVHFLDDSVVSASSFDAAIEVDSGTFPPYGNVAADIRGNRVTATGTLPNAGCIGIVVGPVNDAGTTNALIAGNTLSVTDCVNGGAIEVVNGPGDALTVDLQANRIDAAGTPVGILLRNFQRAAGSPLRGRIINNLVTGQVALGGFSAAIGVDADGTQPIDAFVANNTVTGNARGVTITGSNQPGADVTGLVANNLVAGNSLTGIVIEDFLAATVPNGNNLVFANGVDQFLPGPGTMSLDPQFVAPADVHLRPSSPAIDRGDTTKVPDDIVFDLDGNPRIRLNAVDIGAFEAAQVSVVAVPTLSPGGLGLLVVGLAVAALLRVGRRCG